MASQSSRILSLRAEGRCKQNDTPPPNPPCPRKKRRGHDDPFSLTRPWHQRLATLGCLLLIVCWLPVPICGDQGHAARVAGGVLLDGSTVTRGNVGFRNEYFPKSEIVRDLEISSHVEEKVAQRSTHEKGTFPHGRQVRVRFSAFGEKFDISLSPLRGTMNPAGRVRALGSQGKVLADRELRLCTYEGRLPHGGWVRAVIRSSEAATVYFLHEGEVHVIEPAFSSVSRQAAAGKEPPRRPDSNSDEAREARLDAQNSATGLKGHNSRPWYGGVDHGNTRGLSDRVPSEAAEASVHHPIHISYRSLSIISNSSPLPLSSATDGDTEDTQLEKQEKPYHAQSLSTRSRADENLGWAPTDEQMEQDESGQRRRSSNDHREGGGGMGQRRSTMELEEVRMPAAAKNEMGSALGEGAFGAFPSCPSSPRVLQLGIAVDTGYFKESTGYGVDQAGNAYGQDPHLTLQEAIDIAESEVQGIVSLVNVIYTNLFRVYIELKSIEIRTEVQPTSTSGNEGGEGGATKESYNPLEDGWNHEPLDHTKSVGEGRPAYGCPYSREDGIDNDMSPSRDHQSTLKSFAAWRESLPLADRLGVWQLLTACYDEGIQGLSYEAAACSDRRGVGWVSRRPRGTWVALARQLSYSLGGGDLDMANPSILGKEGSVAGNEICQYVLNNDDCFQSYQPICGNGMVEPGEDCDDDSPCCISSQCKLVANARCSRGPNWWETSGDGASAEDVGSCCSDDCQFLSSATQCKLPGGLNGVCTTGGCRRTDKPASSSECDINSECAAAAPPEPEQKRTDVERESTGGDDVVGVDGAREMTRAESTGAHNVKNDDDYETANSSNEDHEHGTKDREDLYSLSDSNGLHPSDVEIWGSGDSAANHLEDEDDNDGSGVDDAIFSVIYQGCFQDGLFAKDLNGGTRLFKEEMSVMKCGEWCALRGHAVMGLQNGRRCSCGDSFGGPSYPRVSEDQCFISCSGDNTQRCGSVRRNSMYSIVYGSQHQVGYVASGERGYSGSSGMPIVPIDDDVDPFGQQNRPVGRQGLGINAGSRITWQWDGDTRKSFPVYYNKAASVEENKEEGGKENGEAEQQQQDLEYMGCFRDHPDRREFYVLEGSGDSSNSEEEAGSGVEGQTQHPEGQDDTFFVYPASLTPNVCKTRCMAIGRTYFGLQYGRECRCGDRPPTHDPAANCVSPCTGDRLFVCGGAWANTVYRITTHGSEDAPSGPVPTASPLPPAPRDHSVTIMPAVGDPNTILRGDHHDTFWEGSAAQEPIGDDPSSAPVPTASPFPLTPWDPFVTMMPVARGASMGIRGAHYGTFWETPAAYVPDDDVSSSRPEPTVSPSPLAPSASFSTKLPSAGDTNSSVRENHVQNSAQAPTSLFGESQEEGHTESPSTTHDDVDSKADGVGSDNGNGDAVHQTNTTVNNSNLDGDEANNVYYNSGAHHVDDGDDYGDDASFRSIRTYGSNDNGGDTSIGGVDGGGSGGGASPNVTGGNVDGDDGGHYQEDDGEHMYSDGGGGGGGGDVSPSVGTTRDDTGDDGTYNYHDDDSHGEDTERGIDKIGEDGNNNGQRDDDDDDDDDDGVGGKNVGHAGGGSNGGGLSTSAGVGGHFYDDDDYYYLYDDDDDEDEDDDDKNRDSRTDGSDDDSNDGDNNVQHDDDGLRDDDGEGDGGAYGEVRVVSDDDRDGGAYGEVRVVSDDDRDGGAYGEVRVVSDDDHDAGAYGKVRVVSDDDHDAGAYSEVRVVSDDVREGEWEGNEKEQEEKEQEEKGLVDNTSPPLIYELLHPLKGERLTVGAVATVAWVKTDRLLSNGRNAEGINLWVVGAGGDEEALIGQGIGSTCKVQDGEVCQHSFLVPAPLNPVRGLVLELRGSIYSAVFGRSNVFYALEKITFSFSVPNHATVLVRESTTQIAWESTGSTKTTWIDLRDARTGDVVANVGAVANTGSFQWVTPHHVQEGLHYFTIRPISGPRRFEQAEASELFRVATVMGSSSPPLALISPRLGECVSIGTRHVITWTSPNLDRVRITLQNEWNWEAETLLYEGINTNEFYWQVPPVTPGAGYYLQLENPDEEHEDWQGQRILGGVEQRGFDLIGRGVRTGSFSVVRTQPTVYLRDIFRGQTGLLWRKAFSLLVEVGNSARDDHGNVMPVVLDLMKGRRIVWTVPASPPQAADDFAAGVVSAKMPRYEPDDGLYYLRATSLLHNQAFDVSPEFLVTSRVPTAWARDVASLNLHDLPWQADLLQPGKSYYISWSTAFIGSVTIERRIMTSPTANVTAVKLSPEDGQAFSNMGGFWLSIPFASDLVPTGGEWCGWRGVNHIGVRSNTTGNSGSNSSHDANDNGDCCFTIAVSDASNGKVRDETRPLCISGGAASSTRSVGEGVSSVGSQAGIGSRGGGTFGSREKTTATLNFMKSPLDQWEIGTVQEIQWTSQGLHSPVFVNLLGPGVDYSNGTKEESKEGIHVQGEGDDDRDHGDDSSQVATGRMLQRTLQLGSGLPTAGSLSATLGSGLESQAEGLSPGGGYSIEVRDSAGEVRAVSPEFAIVFPPSLSISGTNSTLYKGDTCKVEWNFTGDPFPVRLQLFGGSPKPVTLSGLKCLPFKTSDDHLHKQTLETSWEHGCVQDPASPLYQKCAIRVDEDARPERMDYCAELAQSTKFMWQSDEIDTTERATHVEIPRDEFELPSVGASFFWKVISVTDPQVHSESETFTLRYPSTLISFTTSGLKPLDQGGAELLVRAVESSLQIAERKLELWSLNPDLRQMLANRSTSTPSHGAQSDDDNDDDSTYTWTAREELIEDDDGLDHEREKDDTDDSVTTVSLSTRAEGESYRSDDPSYTPSDDYDDHVFEDDRDDDAQGRFRQRKTLLRAPPLYPAIDEDTRKQKQKAAKKGMHEENLENLGPQVRDPPSASGAAAHPSDANRSGKEEVARNGLTSATTNAIEELSVVVTLKVPSATAPWQERSPKEIMQLLGFMCESRLLGRELGDVDCASIVLRDEDSSSYRDKYESILSRSRPDRESLAADSTLEVGAIAGIMVAFLVATAVVVRRRKRARRQRTNSDKPGVRYYRKVVLEDSEDIVSVEGEDAFGQIRSPGSFAGAVDSDDDDTTDDHRGGGSWKDGGSGRRRREERKSRRHQRHQQGGEFREAASSIVAKVLSGGAGRKGITGSSEIHSA